MTAALVSPAGERPVQAAASRSASLVLNLRMVVTQEMPALTRLSLMAETEAIWSDAPVRVRWIDKDIDAEGQPLLRVFVMARVVPPPGEPVPWTVGELVRYDEAQAIAIATLTGARRIVDETPSNSSIRRPLRSAGWASCWAGPWHTKSALSLADQHERRERSDARANPAARVRRLT